MSKSVLLLHLLKQNQALGEYTLCAVNFEHGIRGEESIEDSRFVANICKERGIPYYPGCVTPTEIMQALELGITTVKFFPANVYGGLKAMKALAGPFPQIKFIPTGGVDRSNIDEYLAWDKIEAVGGSFYVKEALDKMNENNRFQNIFLSTRKRLGHKYSSHR